MNDFVFLGIDPGVSGALAIIIGSNVSFHDTPVVSIKVGKSLKNQLDPHAASILLRSYKADQMLVTIEKVAPMPSFKGKDGQPQSMGVTSAFNFGRDFGMWIGICAALELPYQLVHPATWKKRMLPDSLPGKDASRVKAMQLYPHMAGELARKRDHARGDALLLARYGMLSVGRQAPEVPEPVAETLFG